MIISILTMYSVHSIMLTIRMWCSSTAMIRGVLPCLSYVNVSNKCINRWQPSLFRNVNISSYYI